ncbi:uncharacterized protein LOC135837915 [Planococcus citri]|uniref:uncharacterized protein LOC135837915 n=1 Tax=Planococcus citri TaxID=170843 RepID=UPI0031F7833D
MDDDNPTELRSLAAKSSCIQLVYDWASCEMSAVDIWKKEEDYGTCPDHECFIWQLNEMQLPGSPVIPNLVLDQIEYHLTSILKQVTDWIRYHHRKNFFHDEPASPLKEYLLKLIWKPDRSIDYSATAKNVLAGSNFNPMEKYRFACTYCFSEEVWKLKDLAEIATDWCFETEPMLVYWSKYLTNQLHTIPVPANDSIDEFMFAKALKEYDLWQPIKYFFGKLNCGARLLQCTNFMKNGSGKYQEEFLALLTECEKSSVYQTHMIEIYRNYEEIENFEGMRQIYVELKGKLSFEQFALIIEKLAESSMRAVRFFNALTPLLVEIWNDASDKDKRRVISTGFRHRFAQNWYEELGFEADYHFKNRHRFRNPLAFIRVMAEAFKPLNFFKKNFYWLVLWQPFASIVELIGKFHFNAKDVEELKKDIREVDVTFLELLGYGEFDDFNSVVSFCYSDDNASRIAYQRRLLMDNLDHVSSALEHIGWRRFYEFIINVFRDTNDGLVSSYTTLLMQHVLGNGRYSSYILIANSIVECIETFVPDHDDLSRAKKTCIDSIFDYLHDSYFSPIFKETRVDEMLIWCYGSETGVAEFKEKINVSKIFISLLKCCVSNGYIFKASDSMEEFLHWYYPAENERKAFKLEMIYSYGDYETIGAFLKKRMYRRPMLSWFFENDAYKIMEFTTKIYR